MPEFEIDVIYGKLTYTRCAFVSGRGREGGGWVLVFGQSLMHIIFVLVEFLFNLAFAVSI